MGIRITREGYSVALKYAVEGRWRGESRVE
jgi:hypothetical protein